MKAEKIFTIKNKLGLHARAAAALVKTTGRFRSSIKMVKDDVEVDGKSIMGVLMLAAAQGSQVMVQANGSDANEALTAIGELIDDKFGEEQ